MGMMGGTGWPRGVDHQRYSEPVMDDRIDWTVRRKTGNFHISVEPSSLVKGVVVTPSWSHAQLMLQSGEDRSVFHLPSATSNVGAAQTAYNSQRSIDPPHADQQLEHPGARVVSGPRCHRLYIVLGPSSQVRGVLGKPVVFADVFGRRRPVHWHGLLRPGHVCGGMRVALGRFKEVAGAAHFNARPGQRDRELEQGRVASQKPSDLLGNDLD